ncbi:hypothetical protein PCG10_004456 [Penicillium crustosum]|uniref:Uncharacterized protein n=1 Tax=Penicillium crustosum TaxID=36656 RepID=A0A9P5GKJ0_PENCR|nr:hypothetical protein PCG10_004456 [Penicillium crustosum]
MGIRSKADRGPILQTHVVPTVTYLKREKTRLKTSLLNTISGIPENSPHRLYLEILFLMNWQPSHRPTTVSFKQHQTGERHCTWRRMPNGSSAKVSRRANSSFGS